MMVYAPTVFVSILTPEFQILCLYEIEYLFAGLLIFNMKKLTIRPNPIRREHFMYFFLCLFWITYWPDRAHPKRNNNTRRRIYLFYSLLYVLVVTPIFRNCDCSRVDKI